MHIEPYYVCDICNFGSKDIDQITSCEARGPYKIPSYLSSRLGKEVQFLSFDYYSGGHNYYYVNSLFLFDFIKDGHNVIMNLKDGRGSSNHRDMDHADPMGSYAYEYLTHTCSLSGCIDCGLDCHMIISQLDFWKRWCALYDIEPDINKAKWFAKAHVSEKQSILRILDRAKK